MWPGGPASECDRWARCGKLALKFSSSSSFGFACEDLTAGLARSMSGAGRDARTSQHAGPCQHHTAAGSSTQQAAPTSTRGTHRLRNIAKGALRQALLVVCEHREVKSKVGGWGALMWTLG